MFRVIVGAILFVRVAIPLILWIICELSEDSGGIGCLIFIGIVLVLFLIL